MKKYVAMLLALLLAFSLIACGNKNVPVDPDEPNGSEITENNDTGTEPTTEPDISTPTPDVPGGNETAGNTPGSNTTDGKTTDTPGGNTSGDNKTGSNDKNHTHNYTSKVVAATCTADGYTLHTCSCGDSYKDSTTKKLGHDYKDKVVKPTATAQGYTEHTCSRCGSSFKDNYKPATGSGTTTHTHSYSSKVVAATCTADGYTLHTCSCGDSYKDSTTKKLGHNYTDKVVAPTTTAQGYTLHTCSRCGSSYKDNYTAVIPSHTHSYTVTNTVAATCSSAGKTTYTCSCGDSYTTTQNALGHSWKEMYEELPVYETVCRTICSACGADITGNASYHREAHALNGENAGSYERYDQVQTGTESQFVGYKCTRCGEWK